MYCMFFFMDVSEILWQKLFRIQFFFSFFGIGSPFLCQCPRLYLLYIYFVTYNKTDLILVEMTLHVYIIISTLF